MSNLVMSMEEAPGRINYKERYGASSGKPGRQQLKRPDGWPSIITNLRNKADMSQKAVAAEAGIATGYLQQIEQGQANPSLAKLERILKVFDYKLIAIKDLDA